MGFDIDYEWADVAESPDETVHRTMAKLRIRVNGRLVTAVRDRRHRLDRDHVLVPLHQVRIPVQLDHRIRRNPITDSDSTRSLIPAEADHRFRCQADHFSVMTGIVHGVRGEGARGAG